MTLHIHIGPAFMLHLRSHGNNGLIALESLIAVIEALVMSRR